MLYIRKKRPPGTFIQYRKTPQATYDGMDTDVKDSLRTALLVEQGYLCAYCMTPLEDAHDKVKIEHYAPRSPSNELEYKNLLAVCCGNEGTPAKEQTCDTHKGNTILRVDPQNEGHIAQITYDGSGEISCKDEQLKEDLDKTLNLNCPRLKSARQQVLKAFFAVMSKDKQGKTASKAYLEKKLEYYRERRNDRLSPYCGILIYYLQRRIR